MIDSSLTGIEASPASFDPAAFRRQVRMILDQYAMAFGIPYERHSLLRRQIREGDGVHSRRTFPGHVTASAIVVDRRRRRTLLIHHRATGRWLQPGGHYEMPESLQASALREAREETGLDGLSLDPWHAQTGLPIDIDTHRIPARPERDEPGHFHHDFRYIVRAEEGGALRPDLAEVRGAEWRSLADLEGIAPQALSNMGKLGFVLP